MAGDYGLTNILGSFALANDPTLYKKPRQPGIGNFFGFGMDDDPNKKILAQNSPSTLSNPDNHIMDIIGGAIAKPAMTPNSRFHLEGVQDPKTDISGIGQWGQVNSTASSPVTGGMAESTGKKFWDTKGGGILSSLLGVIALGGLGAGIGAISGGGRGALRGASYGMGFGALQDMAMRKAAMEAPTNEAKLENELAKAQLSATPTSMREFGLAQKYPEYAEFLKQQKFDPYKSAYLNLSTGREDRANKIFEQKMKEKAIGAQDDLDNLAKIEFGINNIFKTIKDTPYAKRAAWIVPGASHVSEGASKFQQNNSLILSNFSRFTGEKGVLTDQDIKRVEGALFNPLDTPKIVDQKKKTLDEMFSLVKDRLKKKKATLSGEDLLETDSSGLDRQTQLLKALEAQGYEAY